MAGRPIAGVVRRPWSKRAERHAMQKRRRRQRHKSPGAEASLRPRSPGKPRQEEEGGDPLLPSVPAPLRQPDQRPGPPGLGALQPPDGGALPAPGGAEEGRALPLPGLRRRQGERVHPAQALGSHAREGAGIHGRGGEGGFWGGEGQLVIWTIFKNFNVCFRSCSLPCQ